METDKDKKEHSIIRRLTIGLTLTIGVVSVIATTLLGVERMREGRADLEKEADKSIAHLVTILEQSLWDFDEKRTEITGKVYARDPRIQQLIISGSRGETLYFVKRGDITDCVQRSGDVMHGERKMGEVKIAFSRTQYRESVWQLVQYTCIINLLVIIAVFISTRFLIQAFLRRPLGLLTEIVDSYASEEYSPAARNIPSIEFQPFGVVLSQMGERILGQLKSLRALNVELEEKSSDLSQANECLLEEIAERRRAEEALYMAQYSVDKAVFEVFWIREDAHFAYVNDMACEALGYSREELLELTVFDIDPDFDMDKWPTHWEKIKQKKLLRIETSHRRKDGNVFPVEVTINFLEYDGVGHNFAYACDITERKRDEKERKSLEEQFNQAQKMEAIGHLAGGVAHDFNNLLQVIQGYGEMALEESEKGSSIHEGLEQVMEASNRATTLVRQLLAFSRKQVLELEDMNLGEVVSDLAKMIQRVIGEHIAFNILSDPGLKSIRADKGQIEQILMNLCVNARDAMGEGGTLTIETSNTELHEEFCEINTWAKIGCYVMLSVSDTGCGMDDETQQRIFEPFFTTKEVGRGTGLGLSTVFGIVRQHNGMVNIYSEIGVGSIFKIYLPMIEKSKIAYEETKIVPSAGGPETILLADDDEGVRRVAEIMLRNAGYTVLIACDGEDAIRVFDEQAEVVDLALLDMIMPKLNGRDVAEHILKQRPEIPCLFASGYSADALHTDFVLNKKMSFLQKPYQRNVLLRQVRELLDGKDKT